MCIFIEDIQMARMTSEKSGVQVNTNGLAEYGEFHQLPGILKEF